MLGRTISRARQGFQLHCGRLSQRRARSNPRPICIKVRQSKQTDDRQHVGVMSRFKYVNSKSQEKEPESLSRGLTVYG